MKFSRLVSALLVSILMLIALSGLSVSLAQSSGDGVRNGGMPSAGLTLSPVSLEQSDADPAAPNIIIPPDETPTPDPNTPGFYISSRTAGSPGGVATTPQDILLHKPSINTFEMAIDGSDVGITKPISAFTVNSDGNLLVSFKANVVIAGVGTFTPWDIALFTPTSIGNTTAGTFSWYFDGSDVGLTTTAEKIDALDIMPDNSLLLSTGGTLTVPMGGGTLKAQDEDLVRFAPTTVGAATAGTWSLYFNGTAVQGLGVEDIASVAVNAATGDIFLALLDNFNIGGVSGTAKDILLLHPTGGGSYAASRFWRGPDHGFNLALSGMH